MQHTQKSPPEVLNLLVATFTEQYKTNAFDNALLVEAFEMGVAYGLTKKLPLKKSPGYLLEKQK